jgi:GxxExxY protein
MRENELSYIVRGAIYEVYNRLGPGLFEQCYKGALAHELMLMGVPPEIEVEVPVVYKGVKIMNGFRLDMLVERKLIIELKSVERIHPVHHQQILSYLRFCDLKLGLLVNFNCSDINANIFRKVNGL